MTKELAEAIECLVGEIYEVGHAHGGNAFRMFRNETPFRADEGWGKYYDELIQVVEQAIQKANGE